MFSRRANERITGGQKREKWRRRRRDCNSFPLMASFWGDFFLWSIGSLRTVAYGDSYIIRLPADAGPGLPTAQWIPFAGHPSVPPHCITKHHKTALVNRGRIGQYWGLFQTLIAVMCNTHWCSNCTGISKRRIRPPPQTRDRNILSWPVK